MAKNYSLIWEE